jgi:hypothetical protein
MEMEMADNRNGTGGLAKSGKTAVDYELLISNMVFTISILLR